MIIILTSIILKRHPGIVLSTTIFSLAFLLLTKSDGFLKLTRQCTELFGYDTPSELIGKSARCLHLSEESYLFFGKKHLSAIMKNEALNLTYQLQKRDGTTFWANFTGQPTQNPKGALWTIIDISAQIEAEESLKQSEYKFRLLADNTFDWEYWIDSDGRYIYTSPACERITGYSQQEFLDNPQLLVNLIRADYRDKFSTHLSQEQKGTAASFSFEFPIITKDGQEKWIEHNCKPIFKSNGQSAGRCGNNRDITEHYKNKKEKELLFQQISNAKNQWENTMDSIEDLVMIVNAEEKITRCNRRVANLLNCTYNELLDKHWHRVLAAGGMVFFAPKNNQNECFIHQPSNGLSLKNMTI